jgi:hypothetical protein
MHGERDRLMDRQTRELALLCIMAALGGMLAWRLDEPLFVVAFAAKAGLAAYLSNAAIY